jgi:polar amino acid transport system permease protein
LRWLANGYIELFQGTPLPMQLFLVFFGGNVMASTSIRGWRPRLG